MNKINLSLISAVLALTVQSAAAFDFDRGTKLPLPDFITGFKTDTPAVQPSTPSGISVDLIHFWEELREGAIDDICKSAEIRLKQEAKLEPGPGIGAEFDRYLRRDPEGKLHLIDVVKVDLFGSYGTELLQIPDFAPITVSVGARVSGASLVTQPLKHDRYCKELGTLAELWKIKTAVPAKASRIAEMKVGEIWKLPVTMNFNFGLGVGTAINPYVNVSISGGASRNSLHSVTLRRLAEDKLRMRIRMDIVKVWAAAASANTIEIPVDQLGVMEGENLIAKTVNRSVAKEINKYIAAKVSFGMSRSHGKRLLVEFMLDPRNAEQMEGVEKFLRGDWTVLKRFVELGLVMRDITEDGEYAEGQAVLQNAANHAGAIVGTAPSFAGSDAYNAHAHNFNVTIPVIHSHESNWTSSYNRYQSAEEGSDVLHVRQERKISNGGTIDIPFMGKLIKGNSEKDVFVVNREAADGTITKPVLMYQQMEGFVRKNDGTARDMVGEANDVLKYVGMRGMGVNPLNGVPSLEIFPVQPPTTDADGFEQQTYKTYHSTLMSFKLMVGERGVQSVLMSPLRDIMMAVLNVLSETMGDVIRKIWHLFSVDAAGKVDYDRKAVQKALGVSPFDNNEGYDPMSDVASAARTSEQVIADIQSVNSAGGYKAQSDRLALVAAGHSKSGLKYNDFLKVFVQLVDPADVSASVFVHTDKRVKGQQDVTQTYQFFSGNARIDQGLGEIGQMRDRFAEPTTLSD